MPAIHVAATGAVPAPPATVYALLADYHHGHPSILPPAFSDFAVEEGGTGAGTTFRFRLTLLGRTNASRGVVTEPQPGRVLVETYPDSGIVTTFTVEPDGAGSRVTFASDWTKPGLAGWLERLVAVPALRRLFRDELALLARRAPAYRPEGR